MHRHVAIPGWNGNDVILTFNGYSPESLPGHRKQARDRLRRFKMSVSSTVHPFDLARVDERAERALECKVLFVCPKTQPAFKFLRLECLIGIPRKKSEYVRFDVF